MTHKYKRPFAALILAVVGTTTAWTGVAQQSLSSPVAESARTPVTSSASPDALPTPSGSDAEITHNQQGHDKSARSPDTAGSVSVESLVETALAANPDLVAMRREFDAARARVPQAKALPDPMVSFSNNAVGTPVPFTGVHDDFYENDVGVSQDLPWFGVRRLRGQVASAEAEAKYQEYAVAVRRLTTDVKTAYYDLYNTERALAVLRRDRDILDKMAQVAEARYSVGRAQQVDVINARVEITELVDKEGELESKREIAIAGINKLLFRDPETPIGTLAAVRMNLDLPSFDELVHLASENAPDLTQQRRLIDARSKAVRLAEREAKYPEVGLSFTYHNRPLFKDYYTYGVSLRLPLYAYTKQRYAIEEQSANLSAARARLDSNDSLIRTKIRDAYVRATTKARLIRLHEQGLIPQGTLALESALSAYQVGQSDALTLFTALKRVLDYETRYYELLTDYQKALAEIETFTGVELTKK